MPKNRTLFKKHGHKCYLGSQQNDVLLSRIPGYSKSSRLLRKLTKMRLISQRNPISIMIYKSQGAILQEQYRHIRYYFYMVHPLSEFRQQWEVVIGYVLLLELIITPLEVAFCLPNLRFPSKLTYIRWILDLLFVADIVMTFATGYVDNKTRDTELNPRVVARKYAKQTFVLDAIASIPTYFEDFAPALKDHHPLILSIINVCCVLKFYKFPTMVKYLENASVYLNYSLVFDSVKLLALLLVMLNGVTCTLIKLYIESLRSWGLVKLDPDKIPPDSISNNILLEESRSSVYIRSFRSGTEMSVMAGSGCDIPTMVISAIAPVFIYGFTMFYFVKATTDLAKQLKSKTSSKMKYEGMVSQLKEFMRGRELPKHMQRRLLAYYEFRFQKTYFRESEILATISGQLRQEIVLHSCRKLVELVVFFEHLPLHLLVRITSCLLPEIFLTNDVVCYSNTEGDCMYFIASGTVAVYTKSGKEICHLEDGGHFGEIALVRTNQKRIASVVAIENCQLYKLSRHDFLRAISPYPDLLEKIEKIVEERLETTTHWDDRWKALIRSRSD